MDFTFEEEGIKEGTLARFWVIHPAALHIYMVLCAYASEKTKIAKVTIKTICTKAGCSLGTVVKVLDRLKAEGIIEAPFEGQQGKAQMYKLKYVG